MLLRAATLEGIRTGVITLVFRRWERARVLAGTRLRTRIGVVSVLSVDVVRSPSRADARSAGCPPVAALLADVPGAAGRPLFRIAVSYGGEDPRVALRASVDSLDAAVERVSRLPWALPVLRLIASRPAVRAPDLAPLVGYAQTQVFKRDVRKLKELGLTESLPVGYRLSPRGAAVLALLEPPSA